MEELFDEFRKVREAARLLANSTDEERRDALRTISKALLEKKDYLKAENAKDLAGAESSGISSAVMHRLVFSDDKLSSVTKGLNELAFLPDPIGKTGEKRELDPDFVLEKRTFPIGVIGMIFEARPDALVQIAGLALRSGNGIILKGGKEAMYSNRALIEVIKKATASCGFGSDWIMGIESHEDVSTLLKAEGYVDLLIPRGSNKFVKYVMDNTRIPVIGHADGICATYVDQDADLDMAVKVCTDAKIQYPAACNATETFLIHEKIASAFLPKLSASLLANDVIIHADEKAAKYLTTFLPASEEDFHTEYLALECAVKVVSGVEEAVSHIQSHGSHHTDAILTENKATASYFVSNVDSADVFINCSTRFADGFRFGLGAEVGISTSKLHARGPVGLDGLMTTRWILSGHGETVAEYSGANGKPFHHKELV